MLKMKNADFVAEVNHVVDKTRFKDSGFLCTILQGEVSKGDAVQFLDADGNFIVEQEINIIQHEQRSFNMVKKGEAKDDSVFFEFKHIWEYPINDTKYIVKMNETALSAYKRKPQAMLPSNNELPYQQLITKTIDIEEFVKNFYIYPLSTNSGYYFPDVYRSIGIECLRETKLGALYSVHKISQGGLLYIFYARIDYSAYVKVTGWYYVKNKLSSSDFESIKKGSALSDVIAINSAAQIYENIYNSESFLFNLKGVGLDTYHFLTDGILKIHFANMNQAAEGGQLRVEKKIFANFDDIKSIQSGEKICSIDGHILPMDMID